MYRIELGPDDIGVFRSIEELATAIKTGVLTPKARIFHSASDKWLPIEFHPHYKKARELAAGGVPPAPPPSYPPVRVQTDTLVRTPLAAPSPVAGLPLIDVSTPTKPLAPEPAKEHAHEPAPVYFAPPLPPPAVELEPEPEPPAYVATLLEPDPEPAPVAAQDAEPEEYPAMPLPLSVRYEPAPAPAFVIPPLPEPEREAIFLSVADETAAHEMAPSEPVYPVHEEPAASVVSEPAPKQPRVAAALSSFQLPRVDLRLGQRRRPALIAAAAAVLAVSTHFALSASKPQWELGVGVSLPDLSPRTLRAERPVTPSPTNATVLPASVPAKGTPSFGGASAFSTPNTATEAAPAPQPAADTARPPVVPVIAPPPKVAIAAPKVGTAPSLEGDLKSAAGLVARYDAAHASARVELENGLKTAGFANLFATSRLQPAGLRAARASVGTASAYVQRYRRRESEIEQAYRDSFDLLSARNKWSDGQRRTWETRKLRQEHPEVAKLSSFLLKSLDSLYGILSAQDAAYQLNDGAITFDDATASRAYGELRPWLDRRAHAWADVDAADPTTAARILRAMGTVKLPEGGSL